MIPHIEHYGFNSNALEMYRNQLFEGIAKAPNDERYRLVEEQLWDEVRSIERRRNDHLAAVIAGRNGGSE
ncbi:hypothetical protein [Natronorubrum thiooxidans]|uniref:Uncharacterized protein n=1 Tax=Natronorubrum thiooxidans TaxID=308853 RepID=A0A1N7GPX5_9EURY|nr:hypothetical protein [Natronorubrum thiooxidans]SIS14632.1 hypothetical protein SAMN05421752_11436 [Natronorubrum thiooxidans]